MRFASHETKLHGIYYEPDPRESFEMVAVICDPFAEEKKCAQRILVQMARRMANLGVAVLHFDYRGTGDSGGNFGDFGPTDWLEDIEAAVVYARQRLPGANIGLLGLRMGASLAAEVAEAMADCRWLVLWEPVVDGPRYVRENLRRSLIKAMLTAGNDSSAPTSTPDTMQQWLDLDGYRVSAQARAELEAIDLSAPHHFSRPVLVVNVGARALVRHELLFLAEGYPGGTAEVVVMEPLWSRVGLVDGERLVGLTEHWLSQIL